MGLTILQYYIKESKISVVGILSIYFLWVACLFDPVGQIFSIKFISIGIVYLVLAYRFLCFGFDIRAGKFYIFAFVLFVLFFPAYGLLVALFRGAISEPFIDTSYISAAVYMICSLLYLVSGYMHFAHKALVFSLRLLSLVILVSFLIVTTDLLTDFVFFFVSNGVAYIGERVYSGISFYYIYFIASPMLIFLLCHDAWMVAEKRSVNSFALMTLSVAALFLSGTRASIIISLCAPIFVWMWYRLGRGSLFLIFISVVFLGVGLFLFDIPVVSDMFGAGEESNSIKIGYLSHYSEIFNDYSSLLLGQGFNAHVWSQELAGMLPEGASKTELTYLEAMRVFGLFGWVLLVFCLLYMSLSGKVARSAYPWIAPAVFLYTAISAINPYIFSSNGMLLIGFAAAAIGIVPFRTEKVGFQGHS